MKFFIFLFLFFCISTPLFSLENPEDVVQAMDSFITENVPKNCIEERKELCRVLEAFKKAELPSLKDFKDGNYVLAGNYFSGDINFKHTYYYTKTVGVLFIKKEKDALKVQFAEPRAENEKEEKDTQDFINLLRQKKSPEENSLYKYLNSIKAEQEYLNCEPTKTAYFCSATPKHQGFILIRKQNNSLIVFIFGQVPFKPKSFDTVPGFFISEMYGL